MNNFRIQTFTQDGTLVCKWGSQGYGDGEFMCVCSVAYGAGKLKKHLQEGEKPAYALFVTDILLHAVKVRALLIIFFCVSDVILYSVCNS